MVSGTASALLENLVPSHPKNPNDFDEVHKQMKFFDRNILSCYLKNYLQRAFKTLEKLGRYSVWELRKSIWPKRNKNNFMCLIVHLSSDILSDFFVKKLQINQKIRISLARFQNTTPKDMQPRFRTKLV